MRDATKTQTVAVGKIDKALQDCIAMTAVLGDPRTTVPVHPPTP